jgi:signal transduction histidine kinase
MRERVARFRGTLAVESVPGRGTTIRAAIPPG